jgi:hypothetical protein
MTPLGWLVIPVAIVLFVWRPSYLLLLMLGASLFELSTVFNSAIGQYEFGLSAFSFVQVLIVIRLLMVLIVEWKNPLPKGKFPRDISLALIAFWVWSCASSFVMPRFFAGMTIVAPRGSENGYAVFTPLQWSLSNMAQSLFLTLNVCTVLYGLHAIRNQKQVGSLVVGFRIAVIIVTAAALLQIAFPSLYPYDLLNTNPSDYKGSDQAIDGFHRVTGTFGEPSSGGSFLCAAALGLLASYLRGSRGLSQLVGVMLVIVALLFTTSTTGYVTFVIGACVLLFYFRDSTKKINPGWLAFLAVPIIVIGALRLNPDLFQAFIAVTVEKIQTNSLLNRVLSDAVNFDVFVKSWGFGVGLGSSRSSGLLATFLSTLGIVGAFFIIVAFRKIAKMFPGRPAPSSFHLTFWALMGIIAAGVVGFPDINRPPMWALLTIVVCQLAVYSKNVDLVTYATQAMQHEMPLSLGDTSGIAPSS